MHKIVIISAMVLCIVSCGGRGASKKGKEKEDARCKKELIDSTAINRIFDSQGDTLMLSSQQLTSHAAVSRAFDNGSFVTDGDDGEYDYLHEKTAYGKAFYFPDGDIKGHALTEAVRTRYNLVSVMNRVIHSREWFVRRTCAVNPEEEVLTYRDTLMLIRESQPGISSGFVDKAIPDPAASGAAKRLLKEYRILGRDESALDDAFDNLGEVYFSLPPVATEEEFSSFEEGFWEWYDKEKVIPGIDGIVRMNMRDYRGGVNSEGPGEKLMLAAKREKDIDRRSVLALEAVKFSREEGAFLLGDILESGIWTKYLPEVWISWRANTQMNGTPSSFGIIPNNYYDRLRVKTLDTMVRHCIKEDDPFARCLIENLIECEIIHRMGSIAGNSSFATCMDLAHEEFIHPRLLSESENSN